MSSESYSFACIKYKEKCLVFYIITLVRCNGYSHYCCTLNHKLSIITYQGSGIVEFLEMRNIKNKITDFLN